MGGDDDWEEFFEQCCLMFGQGTCFYDTRETERVVARS